MREIENRATGAMLGLACGDAIGAAVEFKRRGTFAPVTGMRGGGSHGIPAGYWTDDTSMALCLQRSLIEREAFHAEHQMSLYCRWYDHGEFSSTGECFDIGDQTREALKQYRISKNPFSGSTLPMHAGNGSLMRLAPVPVFYRHSLDATAFYAAESSRTTHGAASCIDACRLFAIMLHHALHGNDKQSVLASAEILLASTTEEIRIVVAGSYRNKKENQISSSGYVAHTLEAALWCFYHTQSLEEAILLAANLGHDADTVAAVTGQIAGAFYGVTAIPAAWLAILHEAEWLRTETQKLLAICAGRKEQAPCQC